MKNNVVCVVLAEFGDCDPQLNASEYLSECQLLPKVKAVYILKA